MARTLTPFLAGRFLARGRRRLDPVRSPWNGRLLAQVAQGTAADLDRAIREAHAATERLRALSRRQRADLLAEIGRRLAAEAASLARTISLDAGKPITLAQGEVARCLTVFRLASEEAPRFGAESVPGDLDPRGSGFTVRIERFGAGPVAAISPFNFPLNLVAHKVAPALAVGNAVVLKPPPQAPLAAFRLAEIVAQAGAPAGALQVLHLPIPLAERLATDPAFGILSFTGSDRVGWHLKSVAGRKRVVLELGGNAAAIVHQDAPDLEAVAGRIAWGAFAYAGQVCIKVQRLLVHRPIARRFTDLVVRATRALRVGDPADPRTVVGPLIDDAAAHRVAEWIAEATSQGAVALLRGRRRGRLLGPTILTRVKPDLKVSCREVFGPVLVIDTYRTWDEALAKANDTEYGLQAGIFTADADRILSGFRTLEVGGVIANDIPTVRLDHVPYGGVKASGFGREGVRAAMLEMTEPRVLLQREQREQRE